MSSMAGKLTRGVVLGLCVAAWSAPAMAQSKDPTVGLGVRVDDVLFRTTTGNMMANPTTTVNVVVPINLFGTLRIEPDLEFARGASSDMEVLSEGPIEAQYEETRMERAWAARIGVGAFYMWKPGPRTRIYAGGRLALVPTRGSLSRERINETTDNESFMSMTRQLNFQLGPNSGVEFEISPFFTIGAEGGVIVTRFGEPTTETTRVPEPEPDPIVPDPVPTPVETNRANVVTTDVALFIRWYFF